MPITRLAFITGYKRNQLYRIMNGKSDAPLRLALTLYYVSGGEIDLSSLVVEPDEFKEGIADFIKLTNARRNQLILDKYAKSMHEVRLL